MSSLCLVVVVMLICFEPVFGNFCLVIIFTFTGSVRKCLERCLYIWRTRSRYVIFWLYFGKIHSFAPDFISEESFRPEEFFGVLF